MKIKSDKINFSVRRLLIVVEAIEEICDTSCKGKHIVSCNDCGLGRIICDIYKQIELVCKTKQGG